MDIFGIRIGLVLSLCILLSACDRQFTSLYLSEHPMLARAEATKCIDAKYQTEAKIRHCKMVLQVYNNLTKTINAQQEDPEGLGQKILDTQLQEVNAKIALASAKLKVSNAKPDDEAMVQTELAQANKLYNQLHDEVGMLLAIAGLNSPE